MSLEELCDLNSAWGDDKFIGFLSETFCEGVGLHVGVGEVPFPFGGFDFVSGEGVYFLDVLSFLNDVDEVSVSGGSSDAEFFEGFNETGFGVVGLCSGPVHVDLNALGGHVRLWGL